jgi:hypothetical protein
MTPWEYLRHWEMSDRGPEQNTLEYITDKMQTRYPGNYTVGKRTIPCKQWDPWRESYHVLVFASPEEETMFRLRW